MKLIVGLGNSGGEYKNTRHNAGIMAIEHLAHFMKADGWKKNSKIDSEICITKNHAILVKPLTFMNESGKTIKKVFHYYNFESVSDLTILHDDLDIALGEYKIQTGHGPALHRGINSVEVEFGSEWFERVRIGVDNRNSDKRISGEDYVLQNFTQEEIKILSEVFEKISKDFINRYFNS